MRRRRFVGLLGVAAGTCFAGVWPSRETVTFTAGTDMDQFRRTMRMDQWDAVTEQDLDNVWKDAPGPRHTFRIVHYGPRTRVATVDRYVP